MSWQFQADQPIYTQLVARLQQQIVSGVYPPGSKLPSVRELAADAGANPNTVQRAFAELERRAADLYSLFSRPGAPCSAGTERGIRIYQRKP